MKLSDGAHTLTTLSEPPGSRDVMVSGSGLIVEEIGTGVILIWDEDAGQYRGPEGTPRLTILPPDWFFWWAADGPAELGKLA